LNTSNYFEAGHRLRIEVSSSNFPRFDRNLNTGGNNYDESRGVVAHSAVHHSRQYPSQVTVTVAPTRAAALSAVPNTQSHGEQPRNALPIPCNIAPCNIAPCNIARQR
jgi:hypothetical protein